MAIFIRNIPPCDRLLAEFVDSSWFSIPDFAEKDEKEQDVLTHAALCPGDRPYDPMLHRGFIHFRRQLHRKPSLLV